MSSAHKIARLNMDDDVFAADETKVHTLSRQAIADMLETAERLDPLSSAPPPPQSGIRTVDGELASAAQSGEVPAFRAPMLAAVPKLWNEDDEGLEPTRLSERMLLARPAMVTEIMESPPVIVTPKTPSMPIVIEPVAVAPATNDAANDAAREAPSDPAFDRNVRLVAIVAFLATLLPGLIAVYSVVAGR